MLSFTRNQDSTVFAEVTRQLIVAADASVSVAPGMPVLAPTKRTYGSRGDQRKRTNAHVVLATLNQDVHWASLRRGAIVNFYRGIGCLTLKHRLPETIGTADVPETFVVFAEPKGTAAAAEAAAGVGTNTTNLAPVSPPRDDGRARLREIDDQQRRKQQQQQQQQQHHHHQLRSDGNNAPAWIAKSSTGAKAANILISRDLGAVLAHVDADRPGRAWVVQRYIENPHLLNAAADNGPETLDPAVPRNRVSPAHGHGRKYDIRAWVLIDHKMRGFLHSPSVMRMCSRPYDPSDLTDPVAHVSNHCVQEALGGDDFGAREAGNERWLHHHNHTNHQHLANTSAPGSTGGGGGVAHQTPEPLCWVAREIARISASCVAGARPLIGLAEGSGSSAAWRSFQLLGLDFIVTAEPRVLLLEVNGAPAAAEALRASVAEGIVRIALAAALSPEGEAAASVPVGAAVPGTGFSRIC
jgi:hypothetical protein